MRQPSLTTVIADGAKERFTMASERKICSDFTAPRSGDAAAIDLDAERIVMLTGWRAVRHAAKDWRTFSSHAPLRVPIPSIVSLAGDDRGVNVAVEELLRISSPLAHIGRVCPHGSAVDGLAVEVEPGARVSLCWTGANAAPSVFAKPERLILDRAPNPHVAFGGGPHTCLGAPQARAILRGLLKRLVLHTQTIALSRVAPGAETLGAFTGPLGYTELIGRFA